MAAKKSEGKFVVVIARAPNSNWARVFGGVLADRSAESVVLTDARQALYYARESGGEAGLAVNGPRGSDTRVTATVPRVELAGVGFLAECTSAAREAWEKAPVYEGR